MKFISLKRDAMAGRYVRIGNNGFNNDIQEKLQNLSIDYAELRLFIASLYKEGTDARSMGGSNSKLR